MSVGKRTYVLTVLALLVWGILASLLAGYYYYSYDDVLRKTQKPMVQVNIGINYGNDTVAWHNGTKVMSGKTLLDTTMLVAEVEYTLWPGAGAFADSIDGVANSGSFYWMWWMYTAFGWSQGQVACDRYIIGDNETYYWYYEDTSTQPLPSPP